MSKHSLLYKDWEEFRQSVINSTPVEIEDEKTKAKRIEKLLNNYEEFFKYYFPHYYKSEAALFQIKASKRFIENNKIYEVRAWCRGLAKSVRCMFENLYLALTGSVKNIILISATEDLAENLLAPYKIELESNQRIINDYGEQKGYISWQGVQFITKSGVSFTGFGAGQSPRGTRNESIRPDVIIFDDIDTDEEVRNKKRIQKKWEWIEEAALPTTDISGNIRILFNGNIIGKDTCITRAIAKADYVEIINIRDKKGKSTWPQKNMESAIDWLLSKMSYRAGQKEYFNNPIAEGDIFKKIIWDDIPKMNTFKVLIKYGDPSYSNKTNKQNSKKCVVLMSEKDGKFYIINCRLDKAVNGEFVRWFWDLDNEIIESVQVYNYIENNSLQDPYFSQVIKPEFENLSLSENKTINPFSDNRKKPEKFFRIEGNLEPLNSNGKLIFNKKEKSNPHMIRLAEEFLDFSEQNVSDGPDAVEGAVWILQNKLRKAKGIIVKTKSNKKNRL
jgi:hypothetical protein